MKDRKKVLIVDDSLTYRNLIRNAISGEDDILVVGSVGSGEEALNFIRSTPPDIITLDVEMPGMNGLEVLQKFQEHLDKNPGFINIGVIMVSAYTRKGADITIKALEAGAFDFISKPESSNINENMDSLRRQLLVKIRHFFISRSREIRRTPVIATPSPHKKIDKKERPGGIRAVLIGVSTGGPKALIKCLPILSRKAPLPIFIVQHMPPTFTQSLAETLNVKCNHRVIELTKEETVDSRTIYLAQGGKHMALMKNDKGDALVITNEYPPENGFRPSVDVLFRSAVPVYGGDVVAIILTGMGSDGTRGIGALKRLGAYTIAQDEESSVVWGMPGSAVEAGYIDEILSLDQIPDAVERMVYKK